MSASTADRLDQFELVSRVLLEIDDLQPTVAQSYLGMMDAWKPTWPLAEMAETFAPWEALPAGERERRVVSALNTNGWIPEAQAVMGVWFSGQLACLDDATAFVDAPADAYLGALVWGLLHTNPSGLPGPFFGEWAYPPSADVTWVSAPLPRSKAQR